MYISEAWVNYYFDERFVEAVKTKGEQDKLEGKKERWTPLSVGKRLSRKEKSDKPRKVLLYEEERVIYQQGSKPSCWFDSTASALHYKGLVVLGEAVHCLGLQYMNSDLDTQKSKLLELMDRSKMFKGPPKIYLKDRKRVRQVLDVFNISDEEHRTNLYILQLKGMDGHVRHAVAMVDHLIFDSNCKFPLKLEKASLDWCCNCNLGFNYVFFAYEFKFKKEALMAEYTNVEPETYDVS
jgi:hypothetical protein